MGEGNVLSRGWVLYSEASRVLNLQMFSFWDTCILTMANVSFHSLSLSLELFRESTHGMKIRHLELIKTATIALQWNLRELHHTCEQNVECPPLSMRRAQRSRICIKCHIVPLKVEAIELQACFESCTCSGAWLSRFKEHYDSCFAWCVVKIPWLTRTSVVDDV